MNYPQTLDFLFSRLPMYQRLGAAALKFDLDNVSLLMERLGNPHLKINTIHIAGTNGKGSSSHMIASVMQSAGYKTGLFTSPHLKSFTERIKIDGQEITEAAVIRFVQEIEAAIEEVKPSFFEITFAMAMQYFYQNKIDVAIVEVGLGGRLDSTNIITPLACLITNISLDHQYFLGDTLAAIAGEKAGIMKKGVSVVISERQPETASVFKQTADAIGADLIYADELILLEQVSGNRLNVIIDSERIIKGMLPDLKGGYQKANILGVLALLIHLNKIGAFVIHKNEIQKGLERTITNTGLKGRWQILNEHPLIVADTGHNKAGIYELIKEINRQKFNALHIVWGMVDDKNTVEILQLLPPDATYYFVQADIPRALSLANLLGSAQKIGLKGQGYGTVMNGYEAAKKNAANDDMIFIGGSTFVVAEIDEL